MEKIGGRRGGRSHLYRSVGSEGEGEPGVWKKKQLIMGNIYILKKKKRTCPQKKRSLCSQRVQLPTPTKGEKGGGPCFAAGFQVPDRHIRMLLIVTNRIDAGS